MMSKLPAIQFYPADWRKDIGVQSLSFHDRGIWFEMLCVMHESEQRGKLIHNGKAMTEEAIARLIGCPIKDFKKSLTNILNAGVASCDEGIIYNRRMVKDNDLIQKRRAAGSLGGNPNLKKKVGDMVEHLVNQKSKQESTPSSSSSISSSTSDKIQNTESGAVAPSTKKKILKVERPKVEIEIQLPWDSDAFRAKWRDWKDYRWREKKIKFKSAQSELEQLKHLYQISNGEEQTAIAIIEQSMNNTWTGLFELKNSNQNHVKAKSTIDPVWRQ